MVQIDIRKHLAYLNEKYGVELETDDVSDGYHTFGCLYKQRYPEEDWYLFDCEEVERAPEWDGHTTEDVTRLLSLQTPSIPNVVGTMTLNKYNQPSEE